METSTDYRLFVGKTFPDKKYTFYSSESRYYLVFATTCPDGFMEVPEDVMSELNDEEKIWLLRAKMDVNIAYIKEHTKEYTDFLGEFADNFEKELQEEMRAYEKK